MNLTRHVYAILGLGVVLAAVSVANSTSIKKLAPPTTPVVVTNTATNPVKVEVQGTPNVNASGTVNIGNPGGSPVPVRDVDAPTPFHTIDGMQLGQFDVDKVSGVIYTVPAGKRLVIDTVVMSSFAMPAGQRMVAMGLSPGYYIPFEVHDNGVDYDGYPRFVAHFNGHLRFNAGTQIKFFAERDDAGSTTAGVEIVLSGYLENVPTV